MVDSSNTEMLGRVKGNRERLETAADALERAVTRPSGDEPVWRNAVGAAAHEVHAALAAHVVEVESPGGLFSEIMDRSPRLAHAIERLRDEHVTLGAEASELEILANDGTVDEVRSLALHLISGISMHRYRGAELIWESYNFDIGEGD
jgi:hypothetical protein